MAIKTTQRWDQFDIDKDEVATAIKFYLEEKCDAFFSDTAETHLKLNENGAVITVFIANIDV